eukprot:TRINITY_DN21762_c0_g1_i1.p1 TRINITY_DN21762_c0_g1~~TRINITY_DN21762_c0_g1_i1.p1  ORF type:complete len:295 (-),score=56.39 TRINITY_DN21762_c0_g1_i1:21-905(-)
METVEERIETKIPQEKEPGLLWIWDTKWVLHYYYLSTGLLSAYPNKLSHNDNDSDNNNQQNDIPKYRIHLNKITAKQITSSEEDTDQALHKFAWKISSLGLLFANSTDTERDLWIHFVADHIIHTERSKPKPLPKRLNTKPRHDRSPSTQTQNSSRTPASLSPTSLPPLPTFNTTKGMSKTPSRVESRGEKAKNRITRTISTPLVLFSKEKEHKWRSRPAIREEIAPSLHKTNEVLLVYGVLVFPRDRSYVSKGRKPQPQRIPTSESLFFDIAEVCEDRVFFQSLDVKYEYHNN